MDDFGAAHQVGEIAQEVGTEAVGGVKKIAQTISAQVTGQQRAAAADAQNLAKLRKNDEKFSEQGQQEVLAKIRAIKNAYGQSEFASRRKKIVEQRQETQVAAQSTQVAVAKRVESKDIAIAKIRSSAESSRNMGGE